MFALGPAVSGRAAAQPAPPPTPTGVAMIEDAARLGDPIALDAAIVTAIVRDPANVEAIIRRALAAAPERRAAILRLATETFPGFAGRIARAAAAPGAAPPPPAPTPARPETPAAPAAPAPAPPPYSKWSGEIALGGTLTTGNTETERANAALQATNERRRWTHRFGLTYDFASESGTISADRLVANAETNYDITERVYSFGFAEYEDDRFSGFDYVVTGAGGLGYRLIKDGPVTLMVDAGPGLRQSKRRDTGDIENEAIGRGRVRFKWQISETADFTNDTTVVTGSERMTTENKAALTAKVVGSLSARLGFDVRHNSDPPAGTESTDTETKASLVYTF